MPSSFKRKTFFAQNHNEPVPHLRVIISDPHPDDNRVLVVNFTAGFGMPDGDDRCLLTIGDHPFITMQTAVIYSRAAAYSCTHIQQGLKMGFFTLNVDVSLSILKRIQEGARNNDALPLALEKYFDYF